MFDAHCHLHDARIGPHAAELLERARAAGVRGLLLAGVDPAGWDDEDRLAAVHPEVYVSYGVHPQVVAEAGDGEAESLCAALAARLAQPRPPRLVAVGEIGLDGRRALRPGLDRQERAFRAQLALAHAHRLPVALHVLDAHARALSVLRQVGVGPAGCMLHSASAAAEQIREYLDLGCLISFSGVVTRPAARKIHGAARVVPLDRLLAETDAPDQTPAPHYPGRCEPAHLISVIAALAQLRGETAAAVAAATAANACRLFGIEMC